MNRFGIAMLAILACALSAVPAGAQANLGGALGSCDKACRRTMADTYFAALVAHDPSKAAMAPGAKFTENAQAVNVGEGLWKMASEAPSNFKVYGPDGTLTDRDMTRQNPFDFESVHIFKIQKAQIHDIEAMGISLPLHSKNGWSDFWR